MRILKWSCWVVALAATAMARPFTVVAYNVENLHDADGVAQFEEYQPPKYTPTHVLTKVQNVAKIVAQFEGGRGPDVLLFCELEVDATPAKAPLDYDAILKRYAGMKIEEMLGAKFNPEIADLPAEALLVKAFADRGLTGYRVVVPDVLQALNSTRVLAQKCAVFTRFPVKAVKAHATTDARAILEVQVDVDGAPLYLFVNHWKSGAGDATTETTRIANARTLRTRLDEILKADPNADIVIGGDFNSQYNQNRRYAQTMKQTALNDVLGSQGNELAVRGPQRDLYNLWYELAPAARGSDTFSGEWGTLMHLIITRGLYDFRGVQYVDDSFGVAKFSGLNADATGVPVRWSGDGPTGSGFSDHFPIFAKFITVPDNRADRYLTLKKASVEQPEAEAPVRIGYDKIDLAEAAVRTDKLPPGTSIRSPEYKGRIFRIEGTVTPATRLSVEFLGEVYEVFSYDVPLRTKLRADHAAGSTLRVYGELGQYQGRWQFIVQDPSWVK